MLSKNKAGVVHPALHTVQNAQAVRHVPLTALSTEEQTGTENPQAVRYSHLTFRQMFAAQRVQGLGYQ